MPNAGDITIADDVSWPTPEEDPNSDNSASGVAVTTTAQNGATICGTTFVAPTSGRVEIAFNGTFQINSTGTGQVYMGPQVRDGNVVGSGNVIYNPTLDPGCKTGSSVAQIWSGGCSAFVEGLTAGATYNVAAVFFTPDASGTPRIQYFSRRVSAKPLP